jgi:predicted amidohydrolase
MKFRLAMIQMAVEAGQAEVNRIHALDRIEVAARHGADVVVLPEALPLGWTDGSARVQAATLEDDVYCSALREAARGHGIHVCSGLVERAGNQIFNSAVLVAPDGEIVLHHRKIHELEIAHDLYALGDRLAVAETALGRIGVMICADGFAPGQVITRTLGCMGAECILSPCSWAVPADHDQARQPYGRLWRENYGPVARDFRIWIAGVSNVGWIRGGPWKGRKCIGCSLLIDPSGEPAVQGPYGVEAETILYADAETQARPARGDGWTRLWAGIS